MNERKRQNVSKSRTNKAENWMAEKLKKTGLKWRRQVRWGYRIFDFWCHEIGVAVEIDGPEHAKAIDEYRDRYNRHRSAIIVLRVRNFNETDAVCALKTISETAPWKERRIKQGLVREGKSLARRQWKEAGCMDDLTSDLFEELKP